MMITRHHLTLLLGLSAAINVDSFTTPLRPFGTRKVKAIKTTLQAGFATDGYLESLTELARTSSAYSTEDYLNSLARLGDASRTYSLEQNAAAFSSFNLADASSIIEEASAPMDAVAPVTATDAGAMYVPATTATEASYVPQSMGDAISGSMEQLERASEIAANARTSMDEVATRLTDMSASGMEVAQEAFMASSPMDAAVVSEPLGPSVANTAAVTTAAASADITASASASMDAVAAVGSFDQVIDQVGNNLPDVTSSVSDSFSAATQTEMPGYTYNVALEKASEIASRASASMDEVGASLSQGLNSVNGDAPQVNALLGQVAGASGKLIERSTETLMSSNKLLTDMEGSVYGGTFSALDSAEQALTNMENTVTDGVISALEATEAQLTNMENNVLGTLDNLLQSFTGTPLEDVIYVLEKAKASIVGVVGGAIQAIGDTISQISLNKITQFGAGIISNIQDGFNTIDSVVETLVALDIAVVKLLFQVVSFVVKALSGKSIPEWSMAADGIVEQEASKLSAQASATASNLSDRSLGELVMMMGSFLQQMAKLMADSVAAVFGAVESTATPFMGSVASSSMDSASETVSTLLNNM